MWCFVNLQRSNPGKNYKKRSWKNRQQSVSWEFVSQQNQVVYSWGSLSILKTLFPASPIFFNTNSKPLISSLWHSTAGFHSSGMNLSRLEHSAKGHYPGLHVCWAAVLSNSTRCRCDHWVTCEDGVAAALPTLYSQNPVLLRLYPQHTGKMIVDIGYVCRRHSSECLTERSPPRTQSGILFGERL